MIVDLNGNVNDDLTQQVYLGMIELKNVNISYLRRAKSLDVGWSVRQT